MLLATWPGSTITIPKVQTRNLSCKDWPMSSGVGQGFYLVSLDPEPGHLSTLLCCLLYSFLKIISLSLKFHFIFWTLFLPRVYKVSIYKLSLWKVAAVPRSAAALLRLGAVEWQVHSTLRKAVAAQLTLEKLIIQSFSILVKIEWCKRKEKRYFWEKTCHLPHWRNGVKTCVQMPEARGEQWCPIIAAKSCINWPVMGWKLPPTRIPNIQVLFS